MNKLAKIMMKFTFLDNPAEYLRNGGTGSFNGLVDTLKNVLADAYGAIIVIGCSLLGCALVAAFVMFGLMKDNNTVKENKNWVLRLIISVIGVSCALTVVGIAVGIGSSIK